MSASNILHPLSQILEELKNEKLKRLKAQEKKVDHLERAKRKEEIPLIVESMKQVITSCYDYFISMKHPLRECA